jgi:GAF domain-containing protein
MTQRAGADSYKGGASYGRTADLQSRLLEFESTRAGTGWTLRFSAGPSIMQVAYRDERTVNVADIEADAQMRESSATARVVGARSAVAVPVRTENGVVGVMVLARVTVRPFSAGEIELIETFADQAAIAIQNVRLFTEIQDKSRQLEIASRHKSEFLANMST